jgi:hypothetical protein
MRRLTHNVSDCISSAQADTAIIRGFFSSLLKATAIAGVSLMLMNTSAFAEEDCYNGPVHVNDANRGQIVIPRGNYVRLTFTFNAAWENMVFVCDALTGRRMMVKGNYFRDGADWTSPVDNTGSIAYYVVAFHKMRSPNARDAGQYPWINSPMKRLPRNPVEGQSGAYVDTFGFNDGGGNAWDNAMVTAYFSGQVGRVPPPLSTLTLQRLRTQLH